MVKVIFVCNSKIINYENKTTFYPNAWIFVQSQVNINENFDSGNFPSGWTASGFTLFNTSNACSGTHALIANLPNAGNQGQILTPFFVSDGNPLQVSMTYRAQNAAFNGGIRIYYQIQGSPDYIQIAFFNGLGIPCNTLSGLLNPNALPAGTSYRLIYFIVNPGGSNVAIFDDILAFQDPSLWALVSTEYTFDNTYNNILGSNPFSSANTSFGSDTTFGIDTDYALQWKHLVVTYDGINVRMYVDGVLVGTRAHTLNTGNSPFILGNDSNSPTAIDDLKIYNFVLDQDQITNLYNNNTLSNSSFENSQKKLTLWPNPAKDIIDIETTANIKTIQIFSMSGQLVFQSNEKRNNINHLNQGVYMVKIIDAENNQTNMKLIKN